MSDNLTSDTENQQERLIKIGWVIGFVEGDGCFSIGFVRQRDRNEGYRIRKGYKTGYQVSHEFAVTQGAKSIQSLNELCNFFGVGCILINRRYDNHKEHIYRYVVRKRQDLINIIIPFFSRHPMHTGKKKDFLKFAQCVDMMSRNEHLTYEGLVRIANIAQTMNREKPRKTLISILRDHTPDIPMG